MTVFNNPYMQQLGILPMKQEQKPLQGIFSPQGLTTLGASLLAGSGQGAGDAAVIGNAILGTKSYIDQYNDKLNEGALRNASYNLNLANSAADYDVRQKQLGMEGQRFGLQQAELGLKLQQAQQEAAMNNAINQMIMGGSAQPMPQVTSFNIPADATPEQKQSIIMGMAQQAKQQPQMLQGGQQDPQQIMMLGALTKRPELVSYGQNLMKQGKVDEAKQIKQETAVTQLGSVSESLQAARNLLDNTNYVQRPTGFNYALGQYIPSSFGKEMATYVDNLKSNLTFDKLQQLKELSPTGASGLGATNQKEFEGLGNTIAKLDPSAGEKVFKGQLDKVDRYYNNVKNILIKQGVDPARIDAVLGGQSVQPGSTQAFTGFKIIP